MSYAFVAVSASMLVGVTGTNVTPPFALGVEAILSVSDSRPILPSNAVLASATNGCKSGAVGWGSMTVGGNAPQMSKAVMAQVSQSFNVSATAVKSQTVEAVGTFSGSEGMAIGSTPIVVSALSFYW